VLRENGGLAQGLSSLPGQIGVDKIQEDDKTVYPNDMGNMSAPAGHKDIAGRWRRIA
jgi:hypothetical protein